MSKTVLSVNVRLGNYEGIISAEDENPQKVLDAVNGMLERCGKTPITMSQEKHTEPEKEPEQIQQEQPLPVTKTEDKIADTVVYETPKVKERIIDSTTLPKTCSKCGKEIDLGEATASAVYNNGAVICRACRYPGLDTETKKDPTVSNSDPKPEPEQTPKEETPKETESKISNFTCEECHAEITKIQHEISQMFMKKDLCKPCMNKTPKERGE